MTKHEITLKMNRRYGTDHSDYFMSRRLSDNPRQERKSPPGAKPVANSAVLYL
jgi:hypothetical protein